MESFVALALEDEGLVVSEAVKFPVTRRTSKTSHEETQTHGFEVDLVGARADRLVLATVKSFLGSRGVVAGHVTARGGTPAQQRLYALLNNTEVRDTVLSSAAHRYGYRINQIELRLYVGKFAAPTTRIHEDPIRDWCTAQNVGVGHIRVVGLSEVATTARRVAVSKTYRDNAALTAIKVLDAAGMLQPMDAVPRTDTAQHPAANERTRDEDANTTRATKRRTFTAPTMEE